MRDLAMGSVSGVVFQQTFNVLASSSNTSTATDAQNMTAKFNPSMAIIIIVLISAFLFMGFFSIYVRRCTSGETENTNANATRQTRSSQSAAAMPGQGLDRAVVESLPLVGYSLVKGLKGGKDLSECAVCLSDFEDDEDLRLLPKCGHVFHPDCIDMWFHSHSTCPLCRASLLTKSESRKEADMHGEDFHAGVHTHGEGQDEEALTMIHDGPPVPPNGSILELLSREGADRMLAESLRRDGERLDAGLARREVDDNGERAVEMRALNRALSRNSTSFRKASRGVEVTERIGAATDSARYNSAVGASLDVHNGMGSASFSERREKRGAVRSIGSSHSFNRDLRRSRSVGSSGRYIRQLFGNYTDYFSPDSEQDGLRVDRARLLGAEYKLNHPMRKERSENELHNLPRVEIPIWENIDLNEETPIAVPSPSPNSNTSGELRHWGSRGLNYPGSVGRKYMSGEIPPNLGARGVELQGEASGPLYVRRKGQESSVEERTKSDRWNFGSFRRTFSLRRSSSDNRDRTAGTSNEPAKWYSQMLSAGSPASAASKPKKFASPWAGAMKIRRTTPAGDVLSNPPSPSTAFPESFPVRRTTQPGGDVLSTPPSPSTSFPQSVPVADRQQNQQQHQHLEAIQIVTQQP